jgi:hypothetical protein
MIRCYDAPHPFPEPFLRIQLGSIARWRLQQEATLCLVHNSGNRLSLRLFRAVVKDEPRLLPLGAHHLWQTLGQLCLPPAGALRPRIHGPSCAPRLSGAPGHRPPNPTGPSGGDAAVAWPHPQTTIPASWARPALTSSPRACRPPGPVAGRGDGGDAAAAAGNPRPATLGARVRDTIPPPPAWRDNGGRASWSRGAGCRRHRGDWAEAPA